MRLRGPAGSFDLSIVGYQFPAEATAPYDSNWLNVLVSVEHPRGRWRAQDPCLLTYEVASLADWLARVPTLSGAATEGLSFLEPCLAFEVVASGAGNHLLRVVFDHELRPPWAPWDSPEVDEVFVDIPIDREQLERASADLRRALERFPQRADR